MLRKKANPVKGQQHPPAASGPAGLALGKGGKICGPLTNHHPKAKLANPVRAKNNDRSWQRQKLAEQARTSRTEIPPDAPEPELCWG